MTDGCSLCGLPFLCKTRTGVKRPWWHRFTLCAYTGDGPVLLHAPCLFLVRWRWPGWSFVPWPR